MPRAIDQRNLLNEAVTTATSYVSFNITRTTKVLEFILHMKEGEPKPEPTIIDILNDSLRKGTNDPDSFPTVEIIAERMGIERDTLRWWLENDREFIQGLTTVKEAFDKDPWKDTLDDEIKLDAATLSFGISFVLEETKKRYTV